VSARRLIALALLLTGVPVLAQSNAVSMPPVAAPDRARQAAAAELIDLIFPPATREQMIDTMMRSTLANIQQAMLQDGAVAKLMGDDPRARKLFEDFLVAQQKRSSEVMHTSLPGMSAAMANAYARRFDVSQLRDLKTFFETPTGRAYMQASMTIMSDPDVAAWQRDVMKRSMSNLQTDAAEFAKQLSAIGTDKKR